MQTTDAAPAAATHAEPVVVPAVGDAPVPVAHTASEAHPVAANQLPVEPLVLPVEPAAGTPAPVIDALAVAPVSAIVPDVGREAGPAMLSRRARRTAATPTEVFAEPEVVAELEILDEVDPADIAVAAAADPADLPDAEAFELLEPDLVAAPAGEAAADESAPVAASVVDEFEVAARLFSFTGETPIQRDPALDDAAEQAAGHHVARGARRSRTATIKRAAAFSFSVGVMGIVGLLTVGMTTPVEAVAAATDGTTASAYLARASEAKPASAEIQAYVAPNTIENTDLTRTESYATETLAQVASESGITNFSNLFVNNPNCSVQWPFAVGVGMSYGYGMRDGGMHYGIDFTPGNGAQVQSIADGTVRIATDEGAGFGVTIVIDHVINGVTYSSRYAHMQYGSRQVEVGDTVKAGQFIGRTGNTGRSFGAHTHMELYVDGNNPIDPMPILRANTVC